MPAATLTSVVPGDTVDLSPLWDDIAAAAGGRPGLVERVRQWWETSDPAIVHARVAWSEQEPVGMAVGTVADAGPLIGRTLLIVALHVREDARQRGFGRALLAEMMAVADSLGIDQVSVDVEPRDRDANRFYARLGFGPVNTRRTTPVTSLRRRLAREGAADGLRFSIRSRTLARRRAARDGLSQ